MEQPVLREALCIRLHLRRQPAHIPDRGMQRCGLAGDNGKAQGLGEGQHSLAGWQPAALRSRACRGTMLMDEAHQVH